MTPTQPKVLNILLADDDNDDRYFFAKALNQLPVAHTLQTVADGDELMTWLSKHSTQLPDVLFLDLNMPCKNGRECLEEIKQHEKLKFIPVVIYSTALSDESADLLYQIGAHYYLHKCDFSELHKAIQQVLNLLTKSPAQPARTEFVFSMQEA